jgi:hypothetical protein
MTSYLSNYQFYFPKIRKKSMPENKSGTSKPELASPKVALLLPSEEEFRAYLRAEAVRKEL